ncbi:uncharacterized protein NEMAJ01_0854 [Nematocida major]|uniref:uncharacterized protein n=1 Tax=Nematocida major TaxID=1912982 RepID=UPI00200771DD|nr:uncharacterized protein NEMAJ01_0854 [Nematocida major]KAH9385958.1 hypothetical protein NEMAJ01_0854 [Nematocida major]
MKLGKKEKLTIVFSVAFLLLAMCIIVRYVILSNKSTPKGAASSQKGASAAKGSKSKPAAQTEAAAEPTSSAPTETPNSEKAEGTEEAGASAEAGESEPLSGLLFGLGLGAASKEEKKEKSPAASSKKKKKTPKKDLKTKVQTEIRMPYYKGTDCAHTAVPNHGKKNKEPLPDLSAMTLISSYANLGVHLDTKVFLKSKFPAVYSSDALQKKVNLLESKASKNRLQYGKAHELADLALNSIKCLEGIVNIAGKSIVEEIDAVNKMWKVLVCTALKAQQADAEKKGGKKEPLSKALDSAKLAESIQCIRKELQSVYSKAANKEKEDKMLEAMLALESIFRYNGEKAAKLSNIGGRLDHLLWVNKEIPEAIKKNIVSYIGTHWSRDASNEEMFFSDSKVVDSMFMIKDETTKKYFLNLKSLLSVSLHTAVFDGVMYKLIDVQKNASAKLSKDSVEASIKKISTGLIFNDCVFSPEMQDPSKEENVVCTSLFVNNEKFVEIVAALLAKIEVFLRKLKEEEKTIQKSDKATHIEQFLSVALAGTKAMAAAANYYSIVLSKQRSREGAIRSFIYSAILSQEHKKNIETSPVLETMAKNAFKKVLNSTEDAKKPAKNTSGSAPTLERLAAGLQKKENLEFFRTLSVGLKGDDAAIAKSYLSYTKKHMDEARQLVKEQDADK